MSAQFSQTTLVQASPGVASCDLVGEAALLDLETGIYYGLDPVGARIWGLLQQPCRVDQLLVLLQGEYEVTRERCERETLALLGQLAAAGLLRVEHAEATPLL